MMKSSGDLVLYRMERARETLEDARILAEAGRWNTCMNRLYYACFYAVSALLAQDGLSSSKHTGVRGLFNQHYVKTGKVSKYATLSPLCLGNLGSLTTDYAKERLILNIILTNCIFPVNLYY